MGADKGTNKYVLTLRKKSVEHSSIILNQK